MELGLREARNGAEGNGPPDAEKDWATGEKPQKERKNKESIFYFYKHNFKSNLNSPSLLDRPPPIRHRSPSARS